MRKEPSKIRTEALTQAQTDELAALAALPEDQINTRDIPEQTDWSGARRGVFFRPVKKQLTLRLDADLVDWFKTQAVEGEGYQTKINRALREFVTEHDRPDGLPGTRPKAS